MSMVRREVKSESAPPTATRKYLGQGVPVVGGSKGWCAALPRTNPLTHLPRARRSIALRPSGDAVIPPLPELPPLDSSDDRPRPTVARNRGAQVIALGQLASEREEFDGRAGPAERDGAGERVVQKIDRVGRQAGAGPAVDRLVVVVA